MNSEDQDIEGAEELLHEIGLFMKHPDIPEKLKIELFGQESQLRFGTFSAPLSDEEQI